VSQTRLAAPLRLTQRRTKAFFGVSLPLNRGKLDTALV